MADALEQFVQACQATNPVAAALAYPPFTTGLTRETPLNSAPYVYRLGQLAEAFGGTDHRRRLLAALDDRLAQLASAGVRFELLLLGGSFLRRDREPKDLDGLLVYSLAPAADRPVIEAALARRSPTGAEALVDLRLCPADCHPLVLVKRVIFFSNLFSYDRALDRLERGGVLVLPDGVNLEPEAVTAAARAAT